MEYAIKLKNINKTYRFRNNQSQSIKDYITKIFKKKNPVEVMALKDINLMILKGESLGIIGRNGSGKSTLLNIIIGSIRPNKGGVIKSNGKMVRLALGLGVDNNLTARDNIYVNGSVLGLSFKEIGSVFSKIIEFADLEDYVDVPVKFYSKGMRQRLLFSIAMNAKADIFLLDEFFGGTGDRDFRKKSNDAFKTQIVENKTIVIVSHSLEIISKHCSRAIWLEEGAIKMEGNAESVIRAYKRFVRDRRIKRKNAIKEDL